jgi:hypothetical protein
MNNLKENFISLEVSASYLTKGLTGPDLDYFGAPRPWTHDI